MQWVDEPGNPSTPWIKAWVHVPLADKGIGAVWRTGKSNMSVWVFTHDGAPNGPFYFNTWNPKQRAVGPFETIEAAKVAAELTAII